MKLNGKDLLVFLKGAKGDLGGTYPLGEVAGTAYEGHKGRANAENIAQMQAEQTAQNNSIKGNQVAIESNRAKIEQAFSIMEKNGQFARLETEQAFTTRQTADGENIIDEQNVFPKLIKGSTVKSANLINIQEMLNDCLKDNGDGSFTFTKIPTTPYRFTKQFFVNLPAGTYQLSCNVIESTTTASFRAHYIDGTYGERNYVLDTPKKVTFSKQVEFVELFLSSTATDGQYVKFKELMLNDGDTLLPFRPYFSGLKNAYLQSIKSTGRNLFNKAAATMNYGLSISTGGLYGSETLFTSDFIPVKPNTAYKIGTTNESTWWGCCYDTNKKYIGQAKTTAANRQIITIAGTVYLRFCEKKEVFDTLMFNEGNTALPYEPYTKDTFYLPETLELGEWDKYDPQSGILARWTGYATSEAGFTEEEIASYKDAIVSLDGKTLAYNLVLPQDLITYNMRSTH